jgi:hypothetical protein
VEPTHDMGITRKLSTRSSEKTSQKLRKPTLQKKF